jgi:hypothetical protein
MDPYKDYRKTKRYDHLSTAMFNIKDQESFFYAQMNNYGSTGMGFESPQAIKPGTDIEIRLTNPPFKASPKAYRARVRWCNEIIDDDAFYRYKIGVNYL